MGPQVGGEGIRTPVPFSYRVSRPSPTTGRGRLILSSAGGAVQACQPSGAVGWRECSPHEPPHCPHLLGITV